MPEKQLDNTIGFVTSGIGCSTINGLPNMINNNEVAVKVAVRVRPLNNREKLHQHQPCVKLAPESNLIVIGKDKQFSFDYVIPPKTTQSELYEHCVKGLVQSLFEGYNATVFAYGQTGSGKTFTISGNKINSDEEYGIIPRAVHSIFQIINQASPIHSHRSNLNNNNNKEYCVKVNFIEIYKEELKDLLDSNEKDLQIREDETGNTMIIGANEVVCSTLDEVMACFEAGTLLRHTGSTLMNEQSSRSHSVFTISLEQRWSDPSAKTTRDSSNLYDLTNGNNAINNYYLGAKFHFVDLAGSERVHRTGNVGDRFKESIHINSGLLALGNVISALSSNDSKRKVVHIPYRESKITRILKDSLGGNANTLMICCISPSSCNLDESINALKYASRARYIKNKPIVNMDPQTQRFVAMQSEIQALREELHRQRTVMITATSNLDANTHNHHHQEDEIKNLEACLQTSQSEADHYKKLVKEALARFKQLAKTENQGSRKLIDEWLNMFEATKNKADFEIEDYAKQRINQLEIQLKQAMDDLKSDEEIFAERDVEMKFLKENITELETKLSTAYRNLEDSVNKQKEQQEIMLQMQIQLDKQMQNKQNNDCKHTTNELANNDIGAMMNGDELYYKPPVGNYHSNTNNSKLRAKTAPNNHNADENKTLEKNKSRSVYSSPALFTLERVMQSFRARSQILAETLEENDNVLQRNFNSTFDVEAEDIADEENNNIVEEEITDGAKKGTFKVKAETDDSKNSVKRPIVNSNDASSLSNDKKLRDLTINIKMKEELIKELVANSKFTNRINIQYQHKIDSLNKEITQYKAEISDLQFQLQNQSNLITARDPSKTENDLRKQLDATRSKIAELESKQRDTQKALNSNSNQDKRIAELELALSKTQQRADQLQKKIKEEADKKLKLEKDFEKEQQKLKDLENKNEQNQKILKKKTEDLMTAQRRLRSGSNAGLNTIGTNNTAGNATPDVDKHWIEQEIEKLVEEKKQMDLFKEELKRREDLVKKKEILLKEKNELQMKKLRSSQLNRESLNLIDQKIESINKQIYNDTTIPSASSNESNYKELEDTHKNLVKQRQKLEEKIQCGTLLNSSEERRLIEIDEAIEALEIAIDFESETINDQQFKLKDSILLNSDPNEVCDNVLQKLDKVSYEDTRKLVRKFFQKIIDLKELEQKKQIEYSELQFQLEEQNLLVEELKKALSASSNELDRRIIEQKTKSEKNVKSLTQELNECNARIASMEKEISLYKEKIIRLKTVGPKTNASNHSDLEFEKHFDSGSLASNLSQATGSFYIDKGHQSSDSGTNSKINFETDPQNGSTKSIKVQKKDIRRLTEDEILKRSVKKGNE